MMCICGVQVAFKDLSSGAIEPNALHHYGIESEEDAKVILSAAKNFHVYEETGKANKLTDDHVDGG